MLGNLDILSRRAGFNTALRHFRAVTGFIKPVQAGENLADLINAALNEGTIQQEQVRPIMSALLADKFGYTVLSRNAVTTVNEVQSIVEQLEKWNALQIVIAYEHPEAGLFVINPRCQSCWDEALPILRDELVVVYVQGLKDGFSPETLKQAAADIHSVLSGDDVETKPQYRMAVKKKAAAARVEATRSVPSAKQPGRGAYRITPRYSVVVTNELFHNGNVEAWKRIIASYVTTYPSLDVLIYYDNERIKDINTLFKWGKVKHGTPILISVAGDEIRDVSKLQRYLYEGASPRFETFLKGSIDQPLELF